MLSNRIIVALSIIALADRSLTLVCFECNQDQCTPPICSYGTTKGLCSCCDVCLRGPGERCNEGAYSSTGRYGHCSEGFICGEKDLEPNSHCGDGFCAVNHNYLVGTCIADDAGVAGDKCGGCSWGTQCYSGCSEGFICGEKDMKQRIQCDRGTCINPNYEVGVCIAKDAGVAGEKCGGCSWGTQCYSGCSEGFICGEKDMEQYIQCDDRRTCNNPNYGVGSCVAKETVTDLPTTKKVPEVPETTTVLPTTKKAMKVPETTLPTTKEAATTFPWTCGYCKERTLT